LKQLEAIKKKKANVEERKIEKSLLGKRDQPVENPQILAEKRQKLDQQDFKCIVNAF